MILSRFKFRALAIALLFVFALAGCTDDPEPPVEIERGTVQKFYDLYEPVAQLENIECDLYYEYHAARLANSKARVTIGPYVQFGTRTVDIWRTYKLEERPKGAFLIDFTTLLNSDTSYDGYEWYTHTAAINYNGLQNEELISTFATKIDRSANTKTEINMAWDSDSAFPYYCTWVVDGLSLEHETEHAHWFNRVWTIRLYVLFVDSETTVTLHEYVFHSKYSCLHDQSGNEIFDGEMDDWIHDRYVSQKYTPAMS